MEKQIRKNNTLKKQFDFKSLILFKILFMTLILFPANNQAQVQEIIKPENIKPGNDSSQSRAKSLDCASTPTINAAAGENQSGGNETASADKNKTQKVENKPRRADFPAFETVDAKDRLAEKESERTNKTDFPGAKNSSPIKEKFHWKPALIESGIFLGIQHGFRLTQTKTTRELGGPFFRDWGKSIKNLHGWNDSDNWFTNNVAHSLQGGLTGRIFVNNSDRAKKQEFGKSKEYWNSRFKALVWSAAWSTQFELGPLSEASIGNVGLREKNGRATMTWTDLIVTPVVGTGVLIEEDMIDKYVLKNWLEKKNNYRVTTKIKILRSVLTPTTSFSNLLRGKPPWKRDSH